jgi:hypothetical protein
MSVKCRACGREEVEHHDFEPEMPDGCVCDQGTWGDEIVKAPCAAYRGMTEAYCSDCEHDEACHAKAAEVSK